VKNGDYEVLRLGHNIDFISANSAACSNGQTQKKLALRESELARTWFELIDLFG